ncbi:MAG: RluA family pseudouridine synthase [Ruminococcaceae bacterium]|nr:RluA family pseudouridine synthase [Oscillospiraceae bacterium]
MDLIIKSEMQGMTVKEILYSILHLSHGQVTALKKNEEGIILNGERVTVVCRVVQGDILTLALEDKDGDVNSDIEPVNIPIDILYEDDSIVCVNKPSGMPTHPSHGHHYDTLANALCYYYKEKGRAFVFRAVNRLDSETSGVVLIAKDRHSAFVLGKALQRGGFQKEYYALLEGELMKDGIIESYIKRRTDSIIFRCSEKEGIPSEYAKTEYKVLCRKKGNTLVKAMPYTGRTHQLRVHFSSAGYPIKGDSLYGNADDRLMLHAFSLSFNHPVTGQRLSVTADAPEVFSDYL